MQLVLFSLPFVSFAGWLCVRIYVPVFVCDGFELMLSYILCVQWCRVGAANKKKESFSAPLSTHGLQGSNLVSPSSLLLFFSSSLLRNFAALVRHPNSHPISISISVHGKKKIL